MNIRLSQIKTISLHLLFWVLYMVLEYFANLMHLRLNENLRFIRGLLLSMPILVLSTYFLAMFAVPRFLNKRRWELFLLAVFGVAIFVLYGRMKWLEMVNYLSYSREYYKVPVAKVLSNVIRDYATIALGVCIYIIGDYRRQRESNIRLVKAKAEAEIQLLKKQLHPHFLFNSLNNIYSLALIKSDLAADSILKLTELLDYLVYRANLDKVPLSKELQLLDNYIGLERLRYGDDLKVESEITVRHNGIMLAPLLLLPFAENCFKHGGAAADGIFRVWIRLDADHGRLTFQIRNSKPHNSNRPNHAGGIGLTNIRQRLSLLYPGWHQLNIDNLPDSYQINLEINMPDEKA